MKICRTTACVFYKLIIRQNVMLNSIRIIRSEPAELFQLFDLERAWILEVLDQLNYIGQGRNKRLQLNVKQLSWLLSIADKRLVRIPIWTCTSSWIPYILQGVMCTRAVPIKTTRLDHICRSGLYSSGCWVGHSFRLHIAEHWTNHVRFSITYKLRFSCLSRWRAYTGFTSRASIHTLQIT